MDYFNRNKDAGFVLTFILFLPVVFWIGFMVYRDIDYERHVKGHLKRAADSNNIVLATNELNTAIAEIERRGWTKGSTHLIYSTPASDVGFWYENIKASRDELANLSPSSSQLEQTNVLMKLRETLLDESGDSIDVTAPFNIAIYPNVVGFFWTGLIATLLLIASCIVCVATLTE